MAVSSGATSRDAAITDFQQALGRLTARERQVLDRLLIGERTKPIAKALGISPRSVEVYRRKIYLKTSLTLLELVQLAAESGVL